MSGSETATGASTVSLAHPSRPLVAMITMVAASRITALKIKKLAVFDAGTTSSELAWKIATSGTLPADML